MCLFLMSLMSLKLLYLSFHVTVFDVPDVPLIEAFSIHVSVFDVPDVVFKIMCPSVHVPVFDVTDGHQIDVPFIPCPCI